MTIHFSLRTVPELADLPPHERRIVYFACRRQSRRHWQVRLTGLIGFIIGAAAGAGLLMLVLEWSPAGRLVNYFLGGLPWGALIAACTEGAMTLASINKIGPYAKEYRAGREAENAKVKLDYLQAPFKGSADDEDDSPPAS